MKRRPGKTVAFFLSLLLLLPFGAHAGFFTAIAGIFSEPKLTEEEATPANAQYAPLLRAAVHIDPNPSKGGGDITVSEGALVPDAGPLGVPGGASIREANGEISVYIVREGDSLSQIAEMFDVSMNTILWANNITRADLIQPGYTLVILPISGVRYTVEKGDTLAGIAKKYDGNGDDILAYNQLASADDINPGDTIVIPGGQIAPPPAPKSAVPKPGGGSPAVAASGSFIHPVPGAVRTQGIHGYNGVDLGAPAGTAVRAAAGGEVVIARGSGWNGGYGNYVVIKHSNGTQTLYAHLSSTAVSTGQRVSQGTTVGAVGNTGRSTGNHLHFEVRGARNPF